MEAYRQKAEEDFRAAGHDIEIRSSPAAGWAIPLKKQHDVMTWMP